MIISRKKWIVNSVMSFIFLSFVFNIAKTHAMANKKQDTIEKIWVLKNDPKSPWHSKVIPIFLDFTSTKNLVAIRGYNDNSRVSYNYEIKDNYILINNIQFRIVSLSINNLVLQIGEDYFSYSTLDNKSSQLNKLEIIDLLANDKKWKIGNDTIQFTKEEERNAFITDSIFYSLISTKNTRRFYGNFYVDCYKEHFFLYYLIDGQYIENFLEILDINHTSITYKKNGQENVATANSINY